MRAVESDQKALKRSFKRTPLMLNHLAYVTKDMEATVAFYTDVLGLDLANAVLDDRIPSTGDPYPYVHIFFRLPDGSTVAFFECPGLPDEAKPTHAAYGIFNHLALSVESPAALKEWQAWLEENGIATLGPIDHEGIFDSVYFADPVNGLRLELVATADPNWNRSGERAAEMLREWVAIKRAATAASGDLREALVQHVRRTRRTDT